MVEGEKTATAAMVIFPEYWVTTWPGGSGQAHKASLDDLKGRKVYLLPDNDEAGYKAMMHIAEKLLRLECEVLMVNLPPLEFPPAWDIADDFPEGWDVERMKELIKQAKLPKGQTALISYNLEEMLNLNIRPREYLLNPVIPRQGLVMIYAKTGAGKTFVGLTIACAIAAGEPVFGWEAECPHKVLYVDGEMPAEAMQDRLKRISQGLDIELAQPDNLRIITPDLQDAPMPNLSDEAGQKMIEEHLQDVDLVILDNVSTLFNCRDENNAQEWSSIQAWLLKLRREGKSVLLIHHSGKKGGYRGTSKMADILDTIIQLELPSDHKSTQGARFTVKFDKSRGFCGEDAEPFEARLFEQGGALVWQVDAVRNRRLDYVLMFSEKGLSAEKIAQQIGSSKSTVNREQQKLREQGKLS